jgi:tetratricopeptide (TPR) repeat protein
MPTLPTSRSARLWTVAGAVVLCALALGGGWWLGRHQAGVPPQDTRHTALLQESELLRQKLIRGEASDADRQRQLELLVALDRRAEAISLLEPLADRDPDRWSLRLMLAELRRDQGDRAGAERELRQILNRTPSQVDALQLLTLIRLEQGQATAAESQVKGVYSGLIRPDAKPEALGVGLLLAELQQRRGEAPAAETTYEELAQAFPTDQRPLIGLALLRHSRGNGTGALAALQEARKRSPDPQKDDPRLDALAASWGLEKLRGSPSTGPGSSRGLPSSNQPQQPAGSAPLPTTPPQPEASPTGPPAP